MSRLHSIGVRGAVAFGFPVALVFAVAILLPAGYYFVAAGPLCGIVGGLVCTRRWGFSLVLGLCFGLIGFMFSLQDVRSAFFIDVVWTGFVSCFLFWVAGGCAMLTLPAEMRFNGAAALAIPGAIAGLVFQFFYGPAHFLFDLGSRTWWGDSPVEHLLLWLIVGAGGGWLLERSRQRHLSWFEGDEAAKFTQRNRWAFASIAFSLLGLGIGSAYFVRWTLPLGLFSSLSPASVASDWLWGWGWLAAGAAVIGAFKPKRHWAAAGIALAVALAVASFRVEGNAWKSQFNSKYAEKLLRENPGSGDAIYAGNLILAQAALDNNDITNAKRYFLAAAATPGARLIEQSGLDVSVAKDLYERGEKDAVIEYLHRGRQLWPQGAQSIGRLEAAVRSGRRPNFNLRGPGGQR
jgi:hypothetical protein